MPIVCLVLFILHIIVNALRERLERARVTDAFRRYVTPEVVDVHNYLLDSMAVTIKKNGGTQDPLIGDAIMCFLSPLPTRRLYLLIGENSHRNHKKSGAKMILLRFPSIPQIPQALVAL